MSSGVPVVTPEFEVPAPLEPVPTPNPSQVYLYPFVSFDPDGRIRQASIQEAHFTQAAIDEGALYCFGEGRQDRETGQFLDWVDHDGEDWVVKLRPTLDLTFDRLVLAPREEARMPGLPPASVTFIGPTSGAQLHANPGDLEIGWVIPGTYQVWVEAFPALPRLFEFEVRKP